MINKAIELLGNSIEGTVYPKDGTSHYKVNPHIFHQALALLKEQSPASNFIRDIQDTLKVMSSDGKFHRKIMEKACDRLEASEASRKELLAACKIGLNGLKGVLQIAMEFEAKGEVFTKENKNKYKDNIETVKAAIANAQPKVEDKEDEQNS